MRYRSLKVIALLFLTAACSSGPPRGEPRYIASHLPTSVYAMSDTTALVWSSSPRELSTYSLADGSCSRAIAPPIDIGAARYDSARAEFWGSGQDTLDQPKLWQWRGGENPLESSAIKARAVFSIFQGPRRRFVLYSDGIRETAPAWLAEWRPATGLTNSVAVPPPLTDTARTVFWGDEAPVARRGSYVVDLCTGRPALGDSLPAGSERRVWTEAFVGCNQWLAADADLSTTWFTADNGKSWSRRTPLQGEPGDALGALAGDPAHGPTIYALIRRSKPDLRFELWVSTDLGRSWSLLGPTGGETPEVWDTTTWSVGAFPFVVTDGVWVQLGYNKPGGYDWRIRLVHYRLDRSADRQLDLVPCTTTSRPS